MKKLLTLVLLLGLATVTQAAIVQFTASGSSAITEYTPDGFQPISQSLAVSAGDTVTIQMKADTACSGWSISAVASSIVMADFANLATTGTVGPDSGYVEWGLSGLVPDGLLFDTYGATFAPAAAIGTVLMSFSVQVPTDWDGTKIIIAPLAAGEAFDVADSDGPYEAVASYGNLEATDYNIRGIELVPEPITMALLGLGGLALIRRRRA